MITNDTVEVSVTYGDKLTFILRLISIAEEQQLRQKAFGLTDEERSAKEYENNVSILVDLSVQEPLGLRGEGDDAPREPKQLVRDFFAEKTVLKERIAFYAVRGYFMRLVPSDFF